ncbi:hypothetical protein N482_06380 [Pseudoalteromonas luteoviolacea NCIMB 1942]|uniref:Cobalamin-independent methionine synthase MetE N-terminal domain-containing protein n=1 Tax=Pseudoalteromonas luteoviolacea NCIMB 1942 TaxID=1365253 RepID=A0A167E845_9GAMM|nr:hypothetical protein [Pseudoalteromonas luteoviolacea]KZN50191.1 hypothetical protein N482_06380 [Pseudoalteromonas luteoviolacea NCIMB 1942]
MVEGRDLSWQLFTIRFSTCGQKTGIKVCARALLAGDITQHALIEQGKIIRAKNWAMQAEGGIEFIPVGDFAWYDHILNISMLVGAILSRHHHKGEEIGLDTLFRIGRGQLRVDVLVHGEAERNDMFEYFGD